jgi:hypothetical protein
MAQSSTRLLRRLNPFCAQALSAAASLCQSRGHARISIEHWLLKLLERGEGDLVFIARRYEWDIDSLWRGLLDHLDTLSCTVQGKPQLCDRLQQLIKNAWLRASLDEPNEQLRSVHVLGALMESPGLLACDATWPLLSLSDSQLQQLLPLLEQHSDERTAQQLASDPTADDLQPVQAPAGSKPDAVLDRFTQDLTAQARKGEIDPVLGRDDEIRQVIDILSRRRKNNPILVGEPGVGKTALVEGLALRIAQGNVPESLKPVSVRTLDLGLLQAGAGVKGEFEQRLKNVIDAVQRAEHPVLLFIDEAHTLIGAGNQAGGGEYRAQLKRLSLQQSWNELLDQIERMYAEGVNHFWLDLQWYLCQALSKQPAPQDTWADIVKRDLGMFLERLPGIEELRWSDGTPFADETTREWISQQVNGNRSAHCLPAPAVTASLDADIVSLETEAQAQADSEGVEQALAWLSARPDVQSGRQRWLMRLLMARVAERYGKAELALHLLGELDVGAQRRSLCDWEPDLEFEVKARLLKLLRLKAQRSDADKSGLARRMESLLAALVAMDPVRAAVLCT